MEPDELLDASTLTFDPVRRAALDKLNTYFLGPITAEEAEHLNKTLYIFAVQSDGSSSSRPARSTPSPSPSSSTLPAAKWTRAWPS